MGTMAQLNGYRLLLGIDELEKAERTHEHFEAIVEFVDSLPKNTSLFITGTPELVEGGTEGNAFQESHRELYELTVDNRIVLESLSENDLRAFTDKLLDLEKKCLPVAQREYSNATDTFGSSTAAVERFVQEQLPTFRGYLEFLENST